LGSITEGSDDGFTGIKPVRLVVFGFSDGAFNGISLLEELLLLGVALASKEPLFTAPSNIVKHNEA
jgi:hypothetical protein